MSTTTTIATLPVQNHNNGTITSAVRSVPVGFDYVSVLINCTSGNPATPFTGFTHPFNSAAMSITFGVNWSWDGGTTFPGSTQGTQNGSPTGTWGTDKAGNPIMTPEVGLGIPFDSNRGGFPNTYQAFATLAGGPISFGLTIQETVG